MKKIEFKMDKQKLKETGKKAVALPGKAWKRLHDWWVGTEEKPLPTFCFRAKFRRWFLIKYRGYCYYITTFYDAKEDEYIFDKNIIKRKDLPHDAVHVTNQKNTYHVDFDYRKRRIDTVPDNRFTAVDLYIFMKDNTYNEAMRVALDGKKSMDPKQLMMYAVIGVGVVLGLVVYMQSIAGA